MPVSSLRAKDYHDERMNGLAAIAEAYRSGGEQAAHQAAQDWQTAHPGATPLDAGAVIAAEKGRVTLAGRRINTK